MGSCLRLQVPTFGICVPAQPGGARTGLLLAFELVAALCHLLRGRGSLLWGLVPALLGDSSGAG